VSDHYGESSVAGYLEVLRSAPGALSSSGKKAPKDEYRLIRIPPNYRSVSLADAGRPKVPQMTQEIQEEQSNPVLCSVQ
jgi:hypothetical protein